MGDANPVALLRRSEADERAWLWLWCPACDEAHSVLVEGGERTWHWNGDLQAPTLIESILARKHMGGHEVHICHSFIKDGRWRFLSDSTHTLAGTEDVPMVPLPDWLVDEG